MTPDPIALQAMAANERMGAALAFIYRTDPSWQRKVATYLDEYPLEWQGDGCACPCHTIAIPHPIICPDCQPHPVSWYACGFCGADRHQCCKSTASNRRYPMGWFHQRREQVARQLNLNRKMGRTGGGGMSD